MHTARSLVLALSALAISFLAGCGEETGGKLPVSGTITLKGQPIADGSIQFESASAFTGAAIKDGKYQIPAAQGLLPGTYTVRISAPESTAPPAEPGGEIAPPVADRVPAEYNVNSTLKFEAKPGADKFDFDVP
jgi:hypothetical protein